MMETKQFIALEGDYDDGSYKIGDVSLAEKKLEDFYNKKDDCYDYYEYIGYLYDNNAFLTGKQVVELLNKLVEENAKLEFKLNEYELILEGANLNIGTLAALTVKALKFKGIMHVSQHNNELIVYVNPDYDIQELRKFQYEYMPLGVECKFIVVEKVSDILAQGKEIKLDKKEEKGQ